MMTLAPGEMVVLTQFPETMERLFGINGNFLYWEQANINALSAHLAISNTNDVILDSLTYNGYGTWPAGAAGTGKSIIVCDLQSNNGLASSWSLDQNPADSVGDYVYGAQTAQLYASPGRVNCRTTSAPDPRIAESSIFPNPFSSAFEIQTYAPEIALANVIDAMGRSVSSTLLKDGYAMVDLGKSPKGIYFVNLCNEDGYVLKAVKVIHL